MNDAATTSNSWFRWAQVLAWGTVSVGLTVYAYLGIFSRYTSDDYCLSAFFLKEGLFQQLIRRYFEDSSRYTNILFIGLVDKLFGWYNVAVLPALMLGLFVLGLYLWLKELGQHFAWPVPRSIWFYLAALVIYFSLLQAPDLYQTFFWRAGMTSHFAPLVFLPYLGLFLTRQLSDTHQKMHPLWAGLIVFISGVVLGGFSEPPTAVAITVLTLVMFVVFWLRSDRDRQQALVLLGFALAGFLVALIVLALAPANSLRLASDPPPLFELVRETLVYPLAFIVDTFRTLPTPTLVSVALPALLFYLWGTDQPTLTNKNDRWLILLIVVPLLAYLLIAASFAPSVYGQSYPIARARFSGRFLMTSALIVDGAILGWYLSQLRVHFLQPRVFRVIALAIFVLLSFYPLWTTRRVAADIPLFQQRAAAWDARDANIRMRQAQGERDLRVPFLETDPIQDLGDHDNFRLNRCASALYGVNSIVARP